VFVPVIVAVFAHEIPREMGDVGILLKSGFSSIQTVLCNGLINFISLFGVVAGLGLGSIDEAAQIYVLVFVAGNFIYIGADIWRHLLRNKTKILNFLEVMMFALGVGAMYLVLLAESTGEH
jgi:zinc and cadmium transporter